MKKLLMISAIALMAVVARADLAYMPSALGVLNDAAGNPLSDGTFLMVLDLDGSGFDFNNLSGDSWVFDANDVIMDRGAIGPTKGVDFELEGDAFPVWTVSTANIPAGYTANVDQYYVFWFDKSYDVADLGPGAGVHFGVENLGTVGTDPGTYTPDLVGGNAQYQTVPEPATALLIAIGGGMAYVLRRNTRKSIYIG
jgi:hypothetical protein